MDNAPKIQFLHKRLYTEELVATDEAEEFFIKEETLSPFGGTTIAMDQVQDWFFDSLEEGVIFEKRIGVADCSVTDNYCKKTGRDLAVSRMKPRQFQVMNIKVTEKERLMTLSDKVGRIYLLRKMNGCKGVHLLEAEE